MLTFTPVTEIVPTSPAITKPAPQSIKNIDEIFEEFLGFDVADGRASIDTIANYKSQVKLFLQWCIDVELNPLLADKKQIQQYRKYLIDRAYKPATISLKLQVVRRFYDALIEHGTCQINPASTLKAPIHRVASSSSIKYLELEQLQQLLDLTNGTSVKLRRDRVIIGLMALHGLRTVEVEQLNFGDISRQGEQKFITVTSKRSERTIKLRSDFSSWLVAYLAKRGSLSAKTPIVTSLSGNSKGKRLSCNGIRKVVNGYLQAIGLRESETLKLSNHALRHTFGTQVYAATKDIRLVQDALGHASPQTTAKYAHLVDGVAAADAIEL